MKLSTKSSLAARLKWLVLAAFTIGLAVPGAALAQEGEAGRATHEAAGDAAQAEGPGTEQHPGAAHAEDQDPTQHWNWANIHYHGKDEYGGKYGDGEMVDPKTGHKAEEEEPMSAPFLLLVLNFGVLLLILAKWGAPVARKLAQERSDQIKTALDEAAKLRDQAAQKLAEYEARIKNVDAEVQKLVDDIRAVAESDKKRILEAAEAQAKQMQREAEQRIAAEIQYARTALQREVTIAASNATEKLLKDKVSGDDQNKLVSTFLSNVQSQPPDPNAPGGSPAGERAR